MPFSWLIPLATSAISAGTSMASASSASSAAKNAAAAQTAADQAAIAEQRRQFNVNQGNLAPWLAAGRAALGQQSALLGLGNLTAGGAGIPTGGVTAAPGDLSAATATNQPNYAAYVQNNPDLLAAYQSQTGLARGKSLEQFGAEHWTGQGQGENRSYTPYSANATGAPVGAAPGAAAGAGPALTGAQQQQAAIDQLKASPMYQSIYGNGVNTILGNNAATGGLRGGNIQDSLARFGGDALSQVIQNQLTNLGGLSGQGATTGGNIATLGAGTSNNISSLLAQTGANQAGGILSSTGFNNAGNNSALQSILGGLGQSYAAYKAQPLQVASPTSALGSPLTIASQYGAAPNLNSSVNFPV